MTSNASATWRSSTRAWTEVVSLPVPALSSAPQPSKSWSISSDSYRAVPRKSMCSIRCDSPASSCDSAALPVPIQSPSAADRTEGMASVTTRTPDSRVVSSCV